MIVFIFMDKSKKLIVKYKVFYDTLRNTKCSALNNEEIHFNNNGFNHLVRKGRFPRSYDEQRRRFLLLKFVEEVIIKGQVTEKRHFGSVSCFWAIKFKKITVIIRQIGDGPKHFFSIFSK